MGVATRSELQEVLARSLGSLQESRWLADEVLGRAYPLSSPVDPAKRAVLDALVRRRRAGEPLQYVLGTWAFRGLELLVDPRALIPRPETEVVVEVALGEVRGLPAPLVVDLGTGTGAIALSCAAELSSGRAVPEVWATDADDGALALAKQNQVLVATAHPGARGVRFAAGWWFEALPKELDKRVDLVVANPPYVSEAEWAELDPVVRCEPYQALVAGPGSDGTPGLAAVEAIVRGAPDWLAPRGVIVVELSPKQAGPALELARAHGYGDARIEHDLAGRERMLVARR